MTHNSTERDVTGLLQQWSREGDRQALDLLMPMVAKELHRMAQGFFRQERVDHTLQPTALVNEVYMRLVDRRKATWQDRVHFLSFAARTMRRVLVDHSRKQKAQKRGAGAQQVVLEDSAVVTVQRGIDFLALDEALRGLAEIDTRQARIVELHYFAGLTVDEIAAVVEVGTATVKRDLAMARAWLRRRMESPGDL